jgi:hypothetical protein
MILLRSSTRRSARSLGGGPSNCWLWYFLSKGTSLIRSEETSRFLAGNQLVSSGQVVKHETFGMGQGPSYTGPFALWATLGFSGSGACSNSKVVILGSEQGPDDSTCTPPPEVFSNGGIFAAHLKMSFLRMPHLLMRRSCAHPSPKNWSMDEPHRATLTPTSAVSRVLW